MSKITITVDGGETIQVATMENVVAKVSGMQAASQSGAVGAAWKKLFFGAIEFDTFPLYNATVRSVVHNNGVPNGNFILAADGIYRFKAQIYPSPAQDPTAKISMYLGITDRGTTGAESRLLHVSNEEFPGGQHPALSVDALIKHAGVRYYSFDWYFLDGSSVTPTLQLQVAPIYTWASVERLA